MLQLRPLRQSDTDTLVAFVRDALPKTHWAHYKFSEQRVRNAIEAYFSVPDPGIVLVLDGGDGALYGIVVASARYSLVSDTHYVVDDLIYIDANHRSLRLLREIMQYLETWASAVGADELVISTSNGHNADKMAKVLRRQGYSFGSISYKKRLT